MSEKKVHRLLEKLAEHVGEHIELRYRNGSEEKGWLHYIDSDDRAIEVASAWYGFEGSKLDPPTYTVRLKDLGYVLTESGRKIGCMAAR